MKKLLFVLNPYAGMRKANRYVTDIIGIFNRAGYDVCAYVTESQGDAARVVEHRAKEMDLVVCCGGDGTFNETVTGILNSGGDTPIGYIPAGSTNDFAASLKLPANILEAARQIVNGTPEFLDVGRFGSRYFSYVASFGVFTRSSYSAPQNVKNALGHTAYLLEGISELSQLKTEHVRLELDGSVVEGDFLFGAICNSMSIGGILKLDPKQVDMADGKFEVLLVRKPRDFAELTECIQAVTKQTYNCRMMRFLPASRVEIFADPRMAWSLDGERAEGSLHIEAENLHHAIRLIK